MDTNKWLSEWLPLHGMPGVKHMRREDIVKALEDHAAERERAAVRAALEQACKAVCDHCRRGVFLPEQYQGVWAHYAKNPWNSIYDKWVLCKAAAIRALMSEAKPAEVVHRYTIARVDDFGDAWQIHWEADDHGGRATIAKSQLPDYAPTPGATVELRFDVLGGFLGGRVVEEVTPCSNS